MKTTFVVDVPIGHPAKGERLVVGWVTALDRVEAHVLITLSGKAPRNYLIREIQDSDLCLLNDHMFNLIMIGELLWDREPVMVA